MSGDIGSYAGAVVGTAIGGGAAVGHDTGAAVVCAAGATLAEVLRRFGPAWRARHSVSTQQARVWRAIQDCLTSTRAGPGRALAAVRRLRRPAAALQLMP